MIKGNIKTRGKFEGFFVKYEKGSSEEVGKCKEGVATDQGVYLKLDYELTILSESGEAKMLERVTGTIQHGAY